jgi:hypothetical protein
MENTATTTVRISESDLENLRLHFKGDLIQPQDPRYDEARSVYNGMINKTPALIAKCSDVADVISAVNFGQEHNLLVSIKSGGHNGAGLALCDDGLVIDLSGLKGIFIDPEKQTARVESGCVLKEVDHATQAFGMAIPSGIIGTTGIGGITLGGGIGYLTRTYGLTIDNLLEVQMVLADGSYITVNKDSHPDLFWAVRGGGGNFGVVTSFLFRLQPAGTTYAGPMFWSIEKAEEAMKFYDRIMQDADDDLYGFFAYLRVPPAPPFPEHLHNQNVCGILWNYAGPGDKAEEVFKPIREFGPPILDFVGQIPHSSLQTMFDALYPPGMQWYWRADFFDELSDEAIHQHVKYGSSVPTMHSTMHLYPVDGAASRIGRKDTAWNYRNARWSQVIVGVDPDPSNNDRIVSWCKEYYDALHPHSMGGAYVNFMMEEGRDRVKATYGENYSRLQGIKRKYDPDNFFRVNQNIEP